jgi:23S rRNA (adenine2503-C2)-methyltransferase
MLELIHKNKAEDGSIKYAFKDSNGNAFEAVYFRLPPNNGIPYSVYHMCISSQAGCAMGCKFCATGYGGFFSDLKAELMREQINVVRDDIICSEIESETTEFNVVLMGMGEPLANYDNVVKFAHIANNEYNRLHKVAISTVGLTPKIFKLAEDLPANLNFKLYISLHSPYDAERAEFMPITRKYSIQSVLEAGRFFAKKTNTYVRVTYLLLKGVNDTDQHAHDFAKLLDPHLFETQIQLYNATPGIPYGRVDDSVGFRFKDIIESYGFKVIVRLSSGRDVEGGCGQLIKKIIPRNAERVLSKM